MSVSFSKSPVWMVAVIVGLIVATALVAGYVDRPGGQTQVAAADGECSSCPKAGTEECCKVTGTCAKGTCSADGASTCAAAAGTCAQEAATAGTCPATGAVMAQPADSTGATCPIKAAAESGCAGSQCPSTQ
ncbi:MAG: hypothetical protein JSW27_10040 [Phycisphaerales bacterium]|nr:MAG: hypothetical protein JSW27_10040 [Phycisphaerales bacterium]